MKQFFKKIGIFSLLVALVNVFIYFLFTKEMVYESYIYNEKSSSECSVFLLGDSHGEALKNLPNEYGIFNFCYVGDNYQDMYYKLNYLTSIVKEEDVVLISVNNHTLSTYRDVSNNTKRNLFYLDDPNNIHDEKFEDTFFKNKLSKRIPFLEPSYGTFYFNNIKNKLKTSYFQGIGSFSNLIENEKGIAIQNRFEQQFKGQVQSSKGRFFLEKIIELCNDKNIRLIGLKYPVSARYYNKIKNHDMGAQQIVENSKLQVINFQNLIEISDDLFKDQDHLNKKGASIMLKKLDSILKLN